MAARLLVLRALGSLLLVLMASALPARAGTPRTSQDPVRHDITITARDHTFSPAHVEVGTGDILKITFVADDAPYSLAIDAYRISKRATPGKPVIFEFRAERAGTFPFYCDLTTDEGCKAMRGNLVVTTR